MTQPSGATGGERETFGGFALGTLQLALPMSALREVVDCAGLVDLPCPAACVIGGIGLRGVVVPVIDLRIVLGRAAPAGGAPVVVIMLHRGHILGLLADAVTGIFEAVEGSLQPVQVADAAASIFFAGVQRGDNLALVSVLSAEALACLAQVPMARDPAWVRQQSDADDGKPAPDTAVPMMLLRCNHVPLAIAATRVHATLAEPNVTPSALTRGHCRGVVDYGGAQVPAIDLLALCDLGRLEPEARLQAIVMSLPSGFIAFLVNAVVDVVRTQAGDVSPVPAFALPRAALFEGSLPFTSVEASQYLVVSADGLLALDEVQALAALNVTASDASLRTNPSGTSRAASNRKSLITYLLDTEQATPIEQVTEILTYDPAIEVLRTPGPLLGFLVNRGRSIPVLCLSKVTGRPAPSLTASASVLVVESAGELIGFAVPTLRSIEQADWEPAMPDFRDGGSPGGSLARRMEPRQLALVSSAGQERMLPLLDLLGIAGTLQHKAKGQAPADPSAAACVDNAPMMEASIG